MAQPMPDLVGFAVSGFRGVRLFAGLGGLRICRLRGGLGFFCLSALRTGRQGEKHHEGKDPCNESFHF